MEEEKAAAYYNELVRKGEGAARFKQGLGFSSTTKTDDSVPTRGSALPSSSSFFTSFVKASSNPSDFQKQAKLESIQNKLKKKHPSSSSSEIGHSSRVPDRERADRDRHSRRRSRSRDGSGSRHQRRSSTRDSDRDRDTYREKERDREGRRGRRSRSRSHDSDGERRRRRDRGRSRSVSPRDLRWERSGSDRPKAPKERNGAVDYARLIEGYETMVCY